MSVVPAAHSFRRSKAASHRSSDSPRRRNKVAGTSSDPKLSSSATPAVLLYGADHPFAPFILRAILDGPASPSLLPTPASSSSSSSIAPSLSSSPSQESTSAIPSLTPQTPVLTVACSEAPLSEAPSVVHLADASLYEADSRQRSCLKRVLRRVDSLGAVPSVCVWLPPAVTPECRPSSLLPRFLTSVAVLFSTLASRSPPCRLYILLPPSPASASPSALPPSLLSHLTAACLALTHFVSDLQLPLRVSIHLLTLPLIPSSSSSSSHSSSTTTSATASSSTSMTCPILDLARHLVASFLTPALKTVLTLDDLLPVIVAPGRSSATVDSSAPEQKQHKVKKEKRKKVFVNYDIPKFLEAADQVISWAQYCRLLERSDAAAQLLKMSKAVEFLPKPGQTSSFLHFLAASGSTAAMKQFVKAGQVNACSAPDKWTALHVACYFQRWDAVKVLIKAGADPNLLSFQLLGPLHILVWVVEEGAIKKLLSTIKLLLEKGVDIDGRNIEGHTPLMIAARLGKLALLQALVKLGASWNILDRDGETALYHALRTRQTAVVKKLIELGANPKCRGKHAPLPLELSSGLSDSAKGILQNWQPRAGQTSHDGMPKVIDKRTIVYADTYADLPDRIHRLVLKAGINPAGIDNDFTVFRHCLRFAVRQHFLPTPKEGAPEKPARNHERINHGGKNIETLFSELISPGNPKKFFKCLDSSGKGGFGSVFYAKSTGKDRIAVKKMPHITDKEIRQNLDEVHFLKSFNHPNIVRFHAAYTLRDEIWVIMEFMEGGTLSEAVRACSMAEPQIAYCALEILKALDYIHERRIVHRDLKSANIMMSIQGDVKIIDFGLAIDLNNLPPPVSLVGSPFWLPPEMLRSIPHGTPADIWSFGICVVELAEGEPPHRKNCLLALHQLANGIAPTLNPSRAWSPEFHEFVAKCLTIEQQKRGTAEELMAHPFLAQAATRRSMKQILQHLFIEKSLEKSLGMRGF